MESDPPAVCHLIYQSITRTDAENLAESMAA
jgi:hypothetical protein